MNRPFGRGGNCDPGSGGLNEVLPTTTTASNLPASSFSETSVPVPALFPSGSRSWKEANCEGSTAIFSRDWKSCSRFTTSPMAARFAGWFANSATTQPVGVLRSVTAASLVFTKTSATALASNSGRKRRRSSAMQTISCRSRIFNQIPNPMRVTETRRRKPRMFMGSQPNFTNSRRNWPQRKNQPRTE